MYYVKKPWSGLFGIPGPQGFTFVAITMAAFSTASDAGYFVLDRLSSTVDRPNTAYCQWRELPQVSFLSRQKVFVKTKHFFSVTRVCLAPQNVCRDKIMFFMKKMIIA